MWYPFIPYGKLTIIQGDPGDGKTTLVLNLAAKLSKGEGMDENMSVPVPINIIYQTAEDGLADTVMVGKGSVNHNSRKFHAKNTDPERTCLNIEYCNEDIRDVYHELFDEALERYNAKQTRKDRKIDDYYKKILSGKQEQPFHEIIIQIGNRDDMGATTEDGELAKEILDEYMHGFQKRNPMLGLKSFL